MILFPAIDLKQGRCVRLIQGDMDQATVFSDDPAAQAQAFVDQGFEWLHVVDLDGAAGKPMNGSAVNAILGRIGIPVQLGGGIRDMRTVEGWLGKGIAGSSSAPLPCAIPDLCARRRGSSRARWRSASTPRTASWRSRDGRDIDSDGRGPRPPASRMPALRPSSIRTSPATAC